MLLLIHCLLLLLLFAFFFFVFGPCFVVQYLVSFLVLRSSRRGRESESRAGCLKLLFVRALCLFLRVRWVGLQCMIVVFPDHTPYFFHVILLKFKYKKSTL